MYPIIKIVFKAIATKGTHRFSWIKFSIIPSSGPSEPGKNHFSLRLMLNSPLNIFNHANPIIEPERASCHNTCHVKCGLMAIASQMIAGERHPALTHDRLLWFIVLLRLPLLTSLLRLRCSTITKSNMEAIVSIKKCRDIQNHKMKPEKGWRVQE